MPDQSNVPAVVAAVIIGVIIVGIFILWCRDIRRMRREDEERKKSGEKVYTSWADFGADLKNILQKSRRDIRAGFEEDWKADRFPPHVLVEGGVVLTYRFDGTKPSQPELFLKGLVGQIGKIFDQSGKSSDDSAGIYTVVDEKFREIIRANPNADLKKFEDIYSVKVLDVQRKHQLQSGIYVGE